MVEIRWEEGREGRAVGGEGDCGSATMTDGEKLAGIAQ
jgi:hypothetical protein